MGKRRQIKDQSPVESLEFLNPWNHPGWIAYLTGLLPRFQHVRFVGYPSLKDVKNTRIERLYVPVQLSESYVPPEDAGHAERRNVHELLAEDGRLVVLGDPGSGKSTLISYLTTMLASRRPSAITEKLGNLIPLPYILRDLVIDRHLTMDGLLNQFCHQHFWPKELGREDLDDILARQQALIFWDGLDEIGDQEARRALREVFFVMADKYPGCKWLLTSRLLGYDDVRFDYSTPSMNKKVKSNRAHLRRSHENEHMDASRRFASVTYVMPFDDDQISHFAHNWYAIREEHAIQQSAAEFLKAIHDNIATERLARRPNLLTMMALIFRQRARLPNGRALLYDEITDAYLHTIDEEKKLKLLPYPLAEKKRWLARVAYEMQVHRAQEAEKEDSDNAQSSQEILANEEQVTEWIAESMQQSGYGGTRDEAAAFVDYIARRSGLLLPRGLDVDGRGQFAFVHLSFQEYFAAVRLAEQVQRPRFLDRGDQMSPPRPSDFPEFSQREVWRETLYFLAEMFGSREGWPHELLSLLFGENLHVVESNREQEKSKAAALLLAVLVVDPHSGLSVADRQRAISACCNWQAYWNKNVEYTDLTNAVPDNDALRILIASESSEQVREVVTAWFRSSQEIGLSTLDFSNTSLCDLSPLTEFSKLTKLNLIHTKVEDLSLLVGLKRLKSLNVSGGRLSKLESLASLTALVELLFWETRIDDLSPLAGLRKLAKLYIQSTQVSDLSPLSNLAELKTLNISDTPVTDLSPLAGLFRLRTLDLSGTEVQDLSPLAELTELETLNISRTAVSDLSPLRKMSSLTSLDLRDTKVHDLSPLAELRELVTLDIRRTQVQDESPLAGITRLKVNR